jgi:L-ascorbate metabolism protein UlaG (beta-lactamase superfamily)
MYLTWLDSNSWLIELGGTRILLDPWLVGDMTFGNLPWLFKGSRSRDRAIPDRLDLILLSQGLEDHAHPETLKRLDKSIPVVGSPSAAKVARSLGFTQVTTLCHGETFSLRNQVRISATVGSPIGPMVKENGYLLTALDTGTTLYYEPHGFHDPKLKEVASIDVAITPLVDLALPFAGSIIQGNRSGLELAQTVKPQVMIPTAAGGDVTFDGLLFSILKLVGSTDTMRATLADHHLTTQVLELKPGDRTEIAVRSASSSGGG